MEPDWKIRVQRAETILNRWFYKQGVVQVLDVFRILNAQYYYFVTFRESHGLPTDGYGVITDATSMDEAHALARRVYGDAVKEITVEWVIDPGKYPMGEISRHSVRDEGGGEPART